MANGGWRKTVTSSLRHIVTPDRMAAFSNFTR
jgi:hypothetical protein